jgi:Rieske 2Fe-2S family protein
LTTPSLLPTLPGTLYTDPAVFAQEQERIFEQMWFCVVRDSDIGTPGAFRTVQVGRESVLVTRSADGGARAFLNICRHRGAMLCADEQGSVKRTFRCMYHAWSYDLDGKLVAAPNLVKMPTGWSTACAGCTYANGWVMSGSALPRRHRPLRTT